MKKHTTTTFLLAAALLAGCSTSTTQENQSAETVESTASSITALDISNIDNSVSPCEDFYQYANGGWLKANPIPASESAWGSFNELAEKNNAVLRQLLKDAASATAKKGTASQKVGDFYAAGMDSVAINNAGLTPLQSELARIENIQDQEGLLKEVAHFQKTGISPMFSFFINQDEKESTRYAVYAYQGGLGLPDRDYYFNEDARSKKIREEYLAHMQRMFTLTGENAETAKKKAGKVMDLETRMARASKTRTALRDPQANYNKMTVSQMQGRYPNLKWNELLTEMNAATVKDVIVGQPEFFAELNDMVAKVPVNDWKTYLQWHLISKAAPYLHQEMAAENFRFYGTVLSGAKEMKPRWKRVLQATDAALGEALGQLYVQETFSPEAKKKALEMVKNLQLAFKDHVKNLDWMSEETKVKAQQKLDAFVTKIGYPDKWKNYAGLEISRESYLANVQRASEFEFEENIKKLGKPVDRTEWFMSPPTVNAYYNPSMNEIVFPAGILQPPFFDPNADDAVNYGGMGAVIGHELTHGFDDQGSQYDAEGNLKNWWTEEDNTKFVALSKRVVSQFDNYTVLDAVHVNGQLTLGENIADLGGLNIAYTALQKALKDKNPGKINGFTPEQRFFLAWAQIWRINATEEYQNRQIVTDPHAPGKFRTNGPVSNMPEFYEAFGCKPGDKMYLPADSRNKIW